LSPGNFAAIALMLCAAEAGSATGVSGSVHISPAHPGPQRVGESAQAPMVGARVQVRNARGDVVAATVTDAAGHFMIAVPAGAYSLGVDVEAVLPRCATADVVVRDGELAHVDLDCDSGMR